MDIQFRQTLKLFGVLFGVLAFGVLLGVLLTDMGYTPTGAPGDDKRIQVDITIDYGNGDVQSFPGEIVKQGDTVLGLLETLERQGGITIEKRNFPGLGIFVEAIQGVHNTSNSYWQFWVNGEYSKIGASQYALKDGNRVLWKRTSERSE